MVQDTQRDETEPGKRSQRIRQVVEDCLQRRAAGGSLSDQSVIEAHPDLLPGLAEELRKVRLITTACQKAEQGPSVDMHADTNRRRGLEIRCPHCNTPVEMAADTPFTEITCSSCGSRFSLAGDEVETRQAASITTIGHFELVERLGIGGFGTVWKARDTELDRTVALKIPRAGQLDRVETEQFLREARAAAQLKHPNIVAVHEVGRQGETVYIVSDLVRGVALDDWLTGGRPTARQAAELCAKIGEALHHAHQAGVVHRDLKPANVMIDADGQPHIMDFGLAKRDAGEITLTTDGQVLGTPAYMSPEQAEGKAHQVDGRSDVYSLGVILFELLTGELPFRGNARMLIHQVINEEPPSPRKFNGSIPRDLETICLKCMEKEPGRRYATAGELADELRRFLSGEPIHARPMSAPTRAWRWCRRKPVVAGLTVLVAVSLLGGTVISSYFGIEASDQAKGARAAREDMKIERDNAHRHLYLATAQLVQRAWEKGDIGRVQELLDRQRPDAGENDLRGWEWYYLHTQSRRGLLTLSGQVFSVAWSPDGRNVASGSEKGGIKVWDAASGRELRALRGHTGNILSVAWSSDGRNLASASDDGTVNVWDMSTGRELRSWHAHTEAVRCVAWPPDERILASASEDKTIKVWDVDTAEELLTLEENEDQVCAVTWSPQGTRLAASSNDGTVRVWDTTTGVQQLTLQLAKAGGDSLAWSPDGQRLAAATGFWDDNVIKIWNASTGEALPSLSGHTGIVTSVAWNADGRRLASGSQDQTIKLWDVIEAREVVTRRVHSAPVLSVAWSPDGTRLASASEDRTIRIWDASRAEDGATILRGDDGTVRFVAWSPDGKRLAAASWDKNHTIRIWDAATAKSMLILQGHDDLINAVAWSPDGKRLASASNDRTLKVWDAISGRLLRILRHTHWVDSVAWSPDGRCLASSGRDETVRLWKAATGDLDQTLSAGPGRVLAVAWDKDARRLASAGDNASKIWDAATGRELINLGERANRAECVAWSPGGEQLATARRNGLVEIWNAGSGELELTLRGHTDAAYHVAWSPNGRRLASAGRDHTIKLWDSHTGEEVLTLRGHTDTVWSVDWSPDGRRLASTSADGTLRIWHCDPSLHVVQAEPDDPLSLPGNLADDGSKAIPALIGLLQDENWQKRRAAAKALGQLGPDARAAVPALVEALKDEGILLRACAAEALGKIGQRAELTLPALCRLLEDDETVSRQAALALCQFATASPKTVPTLTKHLRGTNWSVLRTRCTELAMLEQLLSPPYVPKGTLTCIDLQPKANSSLSGGPDGPSDNLTNNLAELPQGEQELCGVKLRIADALIRLGGTSRPTAPNKTEGITLKRKFARLYVLHSARGGGAADGTTIGSYRVHFEDGAVETIPIVYGEDVRDWWVFDNGKPVSRGKVAWVGYNALTRKQKLMLRLYLTVWENPHPDKKVTSIDYVSMVTRAAPFCVAMTVEEVSEHGQTAAPETD